jgi:hypothetical protein
VRGDGQGSDGGAPRVPALTVAAGVPLTMTITFAALRRSLPPRRAYDAGFAVYWPRDRGFALGFSLWHLAPQLVLPPRRSRLAFLLGSALVGAASTLAARRTGGLRAAVVAHFLTDACGVGAARFRLGLTSPDGDRATPKEKR